MFRKRSGMRRSRQHGWLRSRTLRSSQRSRPLLGLEPLENRQLLTVVISEFMASNQSTLVDDEGDSSDWIELDNRGPQSVNLDGWYLTDRANDPGQWRLPDVTLGAGEQLLVYASGKDHSDPERSLHTNFRLGADGEYLALTHADGTTVEFAYAPQFPPQTADVSFGLAPDGVARGFFPEPSPGRPNPVAPTSGAGRSVLINEIMYSLPRADILDAEDIEEEFVELVNRGTQSVDVTGWQFTRGVEFVFPQATIPAGDFLVVAANPVAFAAKYPEVTNFVGGWAGKLGNGGESVELVDQAGLVVDSVRYADEGDWGVRAIGPEDRGSRGWIWAPEHDGGGKTLELINVDVSNDVGQNWSSSGPVGGTPGRVNSVAAADVAPLIQDVTHSPGLPRSDEPVTITAHLSDEASQGLTAQLLWRVDGASEFQAAPMFDDGQHDDGEAADRLYAATLPPQPDLTVVEFYVQAGDAGGRERTWPAPTTDGLQVTNALYQVFDGIDLTVPWQPGTPPVYFQVMTGAERDELTNISRRSNAQFNTTFIAVSGTGVDVRYNAGVRIRGSASRNDAVPGNRVNIPSDRPWQGITQINVNARNPIDQTAGSALFRLAGVDVGDVHAVRMFSNGVDLKGGGFYVHSEVLNSEFTDSHYPLDSNGTVYRGRRADESPPGGRGAGLAYLGEDPADYVSYIKYTNASEADWSDVIELTHELNLSPDSTYVEDVQQVLDVDQWFRAIALNALIDNNEFSLMTGDPTGDDYVMYRGVVDERFELIPYDWDTVFRNVTRNIYRATAVPALNRLINHPEFLPRYYAQFLDLIDNVALTEEASTTLDEALGAIASPNQIANIKQFLVDRSAYVKSLIHQQLTVDPGLPTVQGLPQTTISTMNLTGTAPVADTRSVLVNGQSAQVLTGQGEWSLLNLTGEQTTLIERGSVWRYLDDGSDQGIAWRQPGYDDTAWSSGAGQLGYGDGDETTVLGYGDDPDARYPTTYFRSTFQIDDPAEIAGLTVELLYDDGAAVYINGVEAARSNLEPDADYQSYATWHRYQDTENVYDTFVVPPAAIQSLVAGQNEIAIEIHQDTPDSPDIGFDLRLIAILKGDDTPGVELLPGINRLWLEAFDGPDGTGQVITRQSLDIWYDDGDTQTVTGTIDSDTTWTAATGPYRVSGTLTVADGATLTVEPGTTVFFANNARLTIRGRLLAVGQPQRMIRFTREPGNGDWRGIQLVDSMQDNRIEHAILEYGITNDGLIGLEDSQLTLQHATLDHTDRRRIRSIDSSLVVRNSTFTDIFEPGQAPTTDNQSEHIWGRGIPEGGQWIVEGNTFGHITGHNDAIDFDAPRLPGPIPQIRDNLFRGGGDDALDMTGDVYIEGNIFRDYIKDEFNNDPGQSNTISASGGDFWVVRNVFDNVQHASLVKEDAYMYFLNNTVVGSEFAPLYFDLPGQTSGPGQGAFVEGSLFAQTEHVFDQVLPTTDLRVDYSYLPAGETVAGDSNLFGDPHVWGAEGDYQLRTGSGAAGHGPNNADMGARVDAGATLSGIPTGVTTQDSATITVGGPTVTEYRYRLDGGNWSSARAIDQPIQLVGLSPGDHQLAVVGRNILGDWQQESQATVSASWTVSSEAAAQLRINEVLAHNVTAMAEDGSYPDLIELYYDGTAPVDLSGMSLSDQIDQPRKYVFPPATSIGPSAYLVLHADAKSTTEAIHVGFGLSQAGDGVYLFDRDGNLVDSVEFGLQAPDLSIGVIDRNGQWGLTEPTLGGANRGVPMGEVSPLKINEWYASGDVRFDQDFIELYNPQNVPASLEDLYLTDKPIALPNQFQIAPLSFIPAQGFATFIADGDPQDGRDHVNFQLSAVHEHLMLLTSDGQPIDEVFYFPQTSEVSQERVPDGGPNFAFAELPTAGVSNGTGSIQVIPLFDFSWDSQWRYEATGQDLGTAWRESGYDDSSWPSGPGLLGHENSTLAAPMQTTFDIGAITYYFRKTIQLDTDLAEIDATFSTLIDDGAIFYVNGHDVRRLRMPDGEVDWQQITSDSVGNASIEGPFAIPREYLVRGENVIAVEVHQQRVGSSDLVFGMELHATATLVDPQFDGRQRLLDGLRITEVMHDPAVDQPLEFIELQNIGTESVNLAGVRLDGGVRFTFPDLVLEAGQSVVVAQETAALLAEYGSGIHVVGQYDGSLSNRSEELILQLPDPFDAAILRFAYDADWFPETGDGGFSLEIPDAGLPFTAWSDKSSWRANAVPGGTPGYQTGSLPATDGIVINEVLSHTDALLQDMIELYNTRAEPVDVSGWYLSDSVQHPRQFRIPDGTTIPGGGYVFFTKQQFNPSNGFDPKDLELNAAQGDTLWLWRASTSDQLVHIVDRVEFGAAANGESFGRYPNGVGELTPLLAQSPGTTNDLPRVGPVLISEVNYHPIDPSSAALQIEPDLIDEDLEFVEIHNPTMVQVDLTDWRMTDGIDYEFAPGTRLGPGGTLLVVSFDPTPLDNASRLAAFLTHYGLPSSVPIVGGYSGRLGNGGDQIQLQRPDDSPTEESTFIPRLLEDEVRYDDTVPWPIAADGLGASLTRVLPAQLGREASSWEAVAPTPGHVAGSTIPGDFNGDSAVDIVDLDLLCDAIRNDTPGYDLNADEKVDHLDLNVMVQDILGTTHGDANLDGTFNSRDFVIVFQAGEYEDAIPDNSTWRDGDWNCDGEFGSADMVVAFQWGGYVAAAQPLAAESVPAADHVASPVRPTAVTPVETFRGLRSNVERRTRESAPAPSAEVPQAMRHRQLIQLGCDLVDRFWQSRTDSWFSAPQHPLPLDPKMIEEIVLTGLRD